MTHIKRYILLSALLALLICLFVFGASAVPAGDQISIVYGDFSRSFDVSECQTWQDLVNAQDFTVLNMSGGLFIDSHNRVYYYTYDIEDFGPYYLCEPDFDAVFADDEIDCLTYTFSTLSLVFGGESVYSIDFYGSSLWCDFTGDSLDPGIYSDSDGYLRYNDDSGYTYMIYDSSGNHVHENDDFISTHYFLRIRVSLTVLFQNGPDDAGDERTLTGNFTSFNVDDICSDQVSCFDDLNEFYFDYSPYGQVVLIEDITGDEYYLFYDGEFLDEAVLAFSATQDPCAFDLHPKLNQQDSSEPTCTTSGYCSTICMLCEEVFYETVPATGHNFYKEIVITAPTCEAVGLKGRVCSACNATDPDSYSEVPKLDHDLNILGNCKRCDYSRVGDALANVGNSIADGWNNLFGGSSSGAGDAEEDENKTLWDFRDVLNGELVGGM